MGSRVSRRRGVYPHSVDKIAGIRSLPTAMPVNIRFHVTSIQNLDGKELSEKGPFSKQPNPIGMRLSTEK